MSKILEILIKAVAVCVKWTNELFVATDGLGVVVAMFIIVLCVSLFLMPIRGLGSANGDSALGDLARQSIHKGKYSNGKRSNPPIGYKGKYEKRKHGGHRASPK